MNIWICLCVLNRNIFSLRIRLVFHSIIFSRLLISSNNNFNLLFSSCLVDQTESKHTVQFNGDSESFPFYLIEDFTFPPNGSTNDSNKHHLSFLLTRHIDQFVSFAMIDVQIDSNVYIEHLQRLSLSILTSWIRSKDDELL